MKKYYNEKITSVDISPEVVKADVFSVLTIPDGISEYYKEAISEIQIKLGALIDNYLTEQLKIPFEQFVLNWQLTYCYDVLIRISSEKDILSAIKSERYYIPDGKTMLKSIASRIKNNKKILSVNIDLYNVYRQLTQDALSAWDLNNEDVISNSINELWTDIDVIDNQIASKVVMIFIELITNQLGYRAEDMVPAFICDDNASAMTTGSIVNKINNLRRGKYKTGAQRFEAEELANFYFNHINANDITFLSAVNHNEYPAVINTEALKESYRRKIAKVILDQAVVVHGFDIKEIVYPIAKNTYADLNQNKVLRVHRAYIRKRLVSIHQGNQAYINNTELSELIEWAKPLDIKLNIESDTKSQQVVVALDWLITVKKLNLVNIITLLRKTLGNIDVDELELLSVLDGDMSYLPDEIEDEIIKIYSQARTDKNYAESLTEWVNPKACLGGYELQSRQIPTALEFLYSIGNVMDFAYLKIHSYHNADLLKKASLDIKLIKEQIPELKFYFDLDELLNLCEPYISKHKIDVSFEELHTFFKKYEEKYPMLRAAIESETRALESFQN